MLDDQRQFDEFAKRPGGFRRTFNRNYPLAYDAFAWLLRRTLATRTAPNRIVDVGCGDGWTALAAARAGRGTYLGLDTSPVSLSRLMERARNLRSIRVYSICASGELLLNQPFRRRLIRRLRGPADVLICNAALHQIRKVFPHWRRLVVGFSRVCTPGASAIVGEYYYPSVLSATQRMACYAWIRSVTGQNPTRAEWYPAPSAIERALREGGFAVMRSVDTVANHIIPLRYRVTEARLERGLR